MHKVYYTITITRLAKFKWQKQ